MEREVKYCRACADSAFQVWKGWPGKDLVPSLPKLQHGECPVCVSTKAVHNEQIVWVNMGMGLPDYWVLYARDSAVNGHCGPSEFEDQNPDFYVKWGSPYCYEHACPRCRNISPVSKFTPNEKHRQYFLHCNSCGILNVESPLEIPNFDEISSDYERWLEDTSNDCQGLSIINTPGWADWQKWMQKYEPDKLI